MVWYINKNLLSSFVLMVEMAIIGVQKASINESLSVFGKCKGTGNKRNVQKHISVEDKGTRRKISKC